MKPFRSWLLYDATDTYAPSIHRTRVEAKYASSRKGPAKWHVVKVQISPCVAEKGNK